MTAQPATDARTAQEVATDLVAQALRHHRDHDFALEHHGDWWSIDGDVRTNARPGQLDGIVSLTVTDEGTGERVAVTLMVAVATLGIPHEAPPAQELARRRGAGVEGPGGAVSVSPNGAPARPVNTAAGPHGPFTVDATADDGATLALAPEAATDIAHRIVKAATPEQLARVTAASCGTVPGGTGVAILAALLLQHVRLDLDHGDVDALVDQLDDAACVVPAPVDPVEVGAWDAADRHLDLMRGK